MVDAEGLPVEGTLLGSGAGSLEETYWQFVGVRIRSEEQPDRLDWRPAVADSQGMATLFLRDQTHEEGVLYALHEEKKLAGITRVNRRRLQEAADTGVPIEVTMVTYCHVRGRFVSTDFEKMGREVTWTNADVEMDGIHVANKSSNEGDYEFLLPPGNYTLEGLGTDLHKVARDFEVPEGVRELTLDPVDLPATEITLLIGNPAPPLRDVLGWKNTESLQLADLRGNYVLLDFWGYWCGPCIVRMPFLFDLHDKFHELGLTIVGVHVGGVGESIDTSEKLDSLLAETRQVLWNGRDIPYPVALIDATQTKFPKADLEARSLAAADYGVRGYPTYLLIDPEGRVVGPFSGSDEEMIAKLEALLGATPQAQ